MFKNFVFFRMACFFLIVSESVCCLFSSSQLERLDFSSRSAYLASSADKGIEISERENGFFTVSFKPDFTVETGEIFEEQRDVVLPDLAITNIDTPEVAGVAQNGKDTRMPVDLLGKTSKEWPFCVHARLNLQFSTALCGGSATLIGPHHLITAGHNIDDERYGRVLSIEAIFGSEGKVKKISSCANVSIVYVHKTWLQSKDSDYDIALLLLDKSIGRSVGWYGLACLKDEYLERYPIQLTIAGYPKYVGRIGLPGEQLGLPTDHLDFETDSIGNKYFAQMWASTGGINSYTNRIISYKIDTSGGQSGSGISCEDEGEQYVMAVHTNGGNGKNRGTLVRKDLMEEIVGIMNSTFLLDSIKMHTRSEIISSALVPEGVKTTMEVLMHEIREDAGIPYSFYAQAKTAFPEKFEQNTSEFIEFKSLKIEELFLANVQQLGRRLNINQTCFISHASNPDETSSRYIQNRHLHNYYDEFYNTLEKSLAAMGFITYFDLRRDPPDRGAAGHRSVDDFHRIAGMTDFAITVLIPQYKLKFMDTNSGEYKQYIAITTKAETMPSYYVPILLGGDESTSIPPTIYKGKLYERFKDPKKFYENFYNFISERLILSQGVVVDAFKKSFFEKYREILESMEGNNDQLNREFIEFGEGKIKRLEASSRLGDRLLGQAAEGRRKQAQEILDFLDA